MTFGTSAVATGAAGERRDGPRRTCRLRASVAPQGRAPLPGYTIDIGRDGLALLLDCPIPPGAMCDVCFNVFAKGAVQRIDAKAQALNSVFVRDAVRVNFCFSNLGMEAQRLLSEFVNYGATR